MTTVFHRSLFGRLFLIFVVTVAAYVLVVTVVLSNLLEEHPRSQFSRRLLTSLVERLGEPPTPAAMAQLAEDLDISLLVTGPDILWRSSDRLPPLEQLTRAATSSRDFTVATVSGKRVAVLQHGGRTWFVTGFMTPLSEEAKGLLAGGVVAFVLIAYLNHRAVRWLFGPIRDVHRAAESIASGDLGHRIPALRGDEIGQLTVSVNTMAERIQAMLEAKRQLLLAISHEIRSPLARARVAVEMTPEGKPRQRITAALDDINRLVGALLEAERLDGPGAGLLLERFDLRDVILEAAREADDPRVVLRLPDQAADIAADRLRLLLLVRNLLSNALRHGGDKPVELALDAGRLTVTDHGEGIAPSDLARLGEAFYRPDAARRRSTGGHGLGLYLCREIARAHDGGIAIASELGRGTTVTVTLGKATAPRA